jgi:hypothetical protein
MPTFKMEDFPDLPEDQPLLCEIVHAEITKGRAFGDEEARDQVALTFEVVGGDFAGAKLRRWVNAVFSPRSTLGKVAMAAFGDERLSEFDTDDLVGRRLYVVGDFGEDGKLPFLRPRKFRAANKAETNGRGQRTSSPNEPATETVAAASTGNGRSEPDDSGLDF